MQIDIMSDIDINIAVRFIADSRITTVSCAPGLASSVMKLRNKHGAKFKIMTQADWSNGLAKGIDKFVGFTSDDFDVDGFEINVGLCAVAGLADSLTAAYDFILNNINPDAVICLAVKHDIVLSNLDMICKLPAPEEYRLGIEHKPPAVSFSLRTYESIICKAKKLIGDDAIIKVCGNIDSKTTVAAIGLIDDKIKCTLSARQFSNLLKSKDKQQ